MSYNMIFQIVIMASGVYMCYWSVQMKITNDIPPVMVGKYYKKERAKDPDMFIKKTFPFSFLCGVVLFVMSVINVLRLFAGNQIIEFLFNLICVIMVILYAVFLTKAQQKYLFNIDNNKKKKKKE